MTSSVCVFWRARVGADAAFFCILHVLDIYSPLAANFLLEATVERLHHGFEYSDIDIGVLLIRGENVVALGEIVSTALQL